MAGSLGTEPPDTGQLQTGSSSWAEMTDDNRVVNEHPKGAAALQKGRSWASVLGSGLPQRVDNNVLEKKTSCVYQNILNTIRPLCIGYCPIHLSIKSKKSRTVFKTEGMSFCFIMRSK